MIRCHKQVDNRNDMEILDIHTHHLPPVAGQAILNVAPTNFMPQPGQYYSVGFHPWHLSPNASENWELFNEVAAHPQVLAIGEAGLDKVNGTPFSLQEKAFERQLVVALLVQKPLVIHCVRSYNEIMEFKKSFNPDNPWIIHGFRGKKELAKQLLDHGFYLSYGFNYQEDALRATPLDRLLLETDDDLTDIHTLYNRVATHLSLSTSDLTRNIQHNVTHLFFGTNSCLLA